MLRTFLLVVFLCNAAYGQKDREVVAPDLVPEDYPLLEADGMKIVRLDRPNLPDRFRNAFIYAPEKELRKEQLSPRDGKLVCEVVRPGLVFLTMSWVAGGNSSGNWKHEVTPEAELEKTWKKIGPCPIYPTSNILFSKECKAGEIIELRTSKYSPPRPVLAMSDDAWSELESLHDTELRVVRDQVIVSAETDFSKAVRELPGLARAAFRAKAPLENLLRQKAQVESKILVGKAQLITLNGQLANVQNVAANNRLVGAINALEGQIGLAERQVASMEEAVTKARAEMNTAREAYVQAILDSRKLAAQLERIYEQGKEGGVLAQKIAELSAEAGQPLTFAPSSGFRSNLRRLETYEERIHSERIDLRSEGRSFFVSVVINGKYTEEMVVDSGATLISIPHRMAEHMKVKPTRKDRPIQLSLADGSIITARLTTLDSVRVGDQELKDVECAVLGPEAENAEALLGMSFLGEFQFSIDASSSELELTRIE